MTCKWISTRLWQFNIKTTPPVTIHQVHKCKLGLVTKAGSTMVTRLSYQIHVLWTWTNTHNWQRRHARYTLCGSVVTRYMQTLSGVNLDLDQNVDALDSISQNHHHHFTFMALNPCERILRSLKTYESPNVLHAPRFDQKLESLHHSPVSLRIIYLYPWHQAALAKQHLIEEGSRLPRKWKRYYEAQNTTDFVTERTLWLSLGDIYKTIMQGNSGGWRMREGQRKKCSNRNIIFIVSIINQFFDIDSKLVLIHYFLFLHPKCHYESI
jgi:hypothetical protein